MTNMNTLAPHISGSTFGQVIVDTFYDIRTSMVQRAEFKRVHRDLSALTDRELTDIGLHRGQIRDVALSSAKGSTWSY